MRKIKRPGRGEETLLEKDIPLPSPDLSLLLPKTFGFWGEGDAAGRLVAAGRSLIVAFR